MQDSAYEISTDPARLDLAVIHGYLVRSYWSPGIPLAIVEKAIAHSLCFGAFRDGEQVGFARAVTDRATFAYLADVFVLEAHRGKGVAHLLLDAIVEHPDLRGLRRMLLATWDAHGLYAEYGFTAPERPDRLMEIHRPDIHQRGEAEKE